MEYKKLCNLIFQELTKRLKSSWGVAICCKYRSKFEGWLKVELCDIFARHNQSKTVPEKNRIDIIFEDWRIELKTVNTNYRFNKVEEKIRPITKNIDGVISDIQNLKERFTGFNKAVVFVVFPVRHKTPKWQEIHLPKILQQLKELKYREFSFKNQIPGVLYIGLI
jgi:hypothetical protein